MDNIGDRMKEYESTVSGQRLMKGLPVVARVDGRCFHSFTKGLNRPFDQRFSQCMVQATVSLVKETGALIGYTQSDEISLIWFNDHKKGMYYDGRVAKIIGALSVLATDAFRDALLIHLPDYAPKRPSFDARVHVVPSKEEAANYLIWRERDATKNSVNQVAQHMYSQKELTNMNGRELQDLIITGGQNWNNYPVWAKRGTYVQRKTTCTPYTTEELEALPEKHNARTCPGLLVARSVTSDLDMPIFSKVSNRTDVIFDGAEPIVYDGAMP